ncbi:MAG: DUF4240 domain-containing protein [Planctomycetota bacterium]|nr:DUF4240 domain-containing protein [Planctomycetota bacterium]
MTCPGPQALEPDAFWALSEGTAPVDGDTRALVDALVRRGAGDVQRFQERLALLLWRLNGPAYVGVGADGYLSPDHFLYRRCHVVSRGRDHHETYLAEPRPIPMDECEDLLFAAREALQRLEGREVVSVLTETDFETYATVEAWRST